MNVCVHVCMFVSMRVILLLIIRCVFVITTVFLSGQSFVVATLQFWLEDIIWCASHSWSYPLCFCHLYARITKVEYLEPL